VLCPILHDPHEAASKSGKEIGGFQSIHDCRHFGIEEDDDVDVGRVVELARAELAHAENDKAGAPRRLLRIGKRQLPAPMAIVEKKIHCGAQGRFREIAQPGDDLRRLGHAEDVGKADQEMRLALD
jgi:hypothetical protein